MDMDLLAEKRKLLADALDIYENDQKMTGPIRVILLGCGSYNPITNMHLRMFEIARDALHRSGKYKVIGGIISPVNDGYNKKGLISAKHRCAMVRAALRTSDWIKIHTWECDQDSWQPTANVIAHIRKNAEVLGHSFLEDNCDNISPCKKRRPNKRKSARDDCNNSPGARSPVHNIYNHNEPSSAIQVKLLCGADMLESFGVPGLWMDEDIECILLSGIVCITRSGTHPEQFIYESDLLTKYESNIHIVREWIQNEISATKIRRSLRRNESVKYLIQDPVIQYIKDHNLYNEDYKEEENKVKNRLSPPVKPTLQTQVSTPPYSYDEPYWPPPLEDFEQYNMSLVPMHQTSFLLTRATQTSFRRSPSPKTILVPKSRTKYSIKSDSPTRRPGHRTVYFSPSVEDEPDCNGDFRFPAEDARLLNGDSRSIETPSANTSGYQTSSSETSPDGAEYASPSRKLVTDINSVVKRIRRVTIAPETCL